MDFACAKGPSIVTDGFDMVVIRTSATNGSMSLWGGGETLNPECLCCVGWGPLKFGIVLWEMWVVHFLLIHVTPGIQLRKYTQPQCEEQKCGVHILIF